MQELDLCYYLVEDRGSSLNSEKRVGNLVIFFYCLNLKTNLIDKSILFQIAMTNVSLCLMSLSVN